MRLPIKEQDIIEGQVSSIAFGGQGILRHQGFVIFVPFTAIGDVITCRVKEVKKSFATADLLSVITPSTSRTNPLCPYFGQCGGCQIQHLTADAQLKYKLNTVKDALSRIGHLYTPTIAIVPTQLNWAYRRHITLHLRPYENGFQAGYIGIDNQSLVVIKSCPIFNEKEDPVIVKLQQIVRDLPNPDQHSAKVTILKNHQGLYILSFHFNQSFKIEDSFFKKVLQHEPLFAGMIVTIGNQKPHFFGNPYTEVKAEGLSFYITPQTFIQNHPEQSVNIYKHVCEIFQNQPKMLLDLYCGFGITSLLLAKQGHHVVGVEYNKEAIAFAKENAAMNKLHADFIQGDVERILPKLTKHQTYQAMLINPPRTGLTKGVIDSLLKAAPKEIIYVSCMPTTLARDLAILCKEMYEIQDCKVYDMFPQTAHVETLVYLTKKV